MTFLTFKVADKEYKTYQEAKKEADELGIKVTPSYYEEPFDYLTIGHKASDFEPATF